MVEEFLKISYDPSKKVWSSVNYPHKDQVQGSLGDKFLKTMRSIEPTKIIDHFYDTNRQKSVKEVYEQSIVVAKNLQRLGIKKDDLVVFFCGNNEDVSVLTMGCILNGTMVNFCEVHLEEDHTDYVFNILKPHMILYEDKYKAKCLQSLERMNLKCCKYMISIDGQEQANIKNELMRYDGSIDFDLFECAKIEDPQNELALLCLTSGSTGIPKVVQLTHALLLNACNICWNNPTNYGPLKADSIVFSFSPLRWISQDIMLLQSMMMGIKRVSSCGAPSGMYGLEILRQSHITHLFSAPSIFYDILLQLNDNDVESLKSLKMVLLGGEATSSIVLDLARKHCINGRIFNCYGMTEMSSTITNDETINGGKLLPGFQAQILDNHLKPLGPNENGQIAVKPPFPMKGYKDTNCQDLNESGLFITGDYGFIDENGNMHVLGRYKDLIHVNDLVIIPNIWEHWIMDMPAICAARLTGYSISAKDATENAALFVVLNEGVNSSKDEISKQIFKLLKSHIKQEELDIIKNIYYVNSLPITTCGKVDRVALKNLALKKTQIQ